MMNKLRNIILAIIGTSLIAAAFVGGAFAQKRNEKEIRDNLRDLRAQVDDFQYSLDYEMTNNGAGLSRGDVNSSLRRLEDEVDSFSNNFYDKRENAQDIRDIVDAARSVDSLLRSANMNRRIETDWDNVKRSIDGLSANYGVIPDWFGRGNSGRTSSSNQPRDTDIYDTPSPSSSQNAGNYDTLANSSPLTGTYRLDTARSENISDIISTTGTSGSNKQDLESKLEAPEQIALDVRGNQVTLATSNAAPVTIIADGSEKVEQANGRTIRLRATLRNDNELQVSSLGGETDYTIIFRSADSGRTLRVTRRITTGYLRETVFAESVYGKSDNVAGLGIDPGMNTGTNNGGYSSSDPNDTSGQSRPTNSTNPVLGPPRTGRFAVPNGMVLTANLESLIDTKASQNNDRFKLTVQTPTEFRGAIIEGYISGVGRSGQVSGRSNITFNFDSITLRSGERFDFAGTLQAIKDESGKDVKVDAEGTAKGDSQTKETVKRGGLGAGLGAIIGAIAGGGKGAVIGAIIGGGAGAGSVIATGRDDVRLGAGSTLTIQSSSPVRPANTGARDNN